MAGANPRRGCLQFSLRTALLVMMLAALTLGVLFAVPTDYMPAVLLLLHTPAAMIFAVLAIYSRGYWRTFAIGACFPAFFVFISPFLFQILYYDLDEFSENSVVLQRLIALAFLVGAFLVFLAHGALAVLVRWLVESQQGRNTDSEPKVPRAESPFDGEAPSK